MFVMKIEFIPSSKDVENFVEPPIPAAKNIPDWYKKTKKIKSTEILINKNNYKPENLTVKHCAPFFDALSSGYIQKTWTDIYIKKEKNEINFYWSSSPQIMKNREGVNIEIGEDFYPIEFVWLEPWVPKVPKGYSILYTHPLNFLNLPFFSLSAVTDSDNYFHTFNGQYPFFIKKNFEGIIPKGTPMYQIIPIKRNSWAMKKEVFNEKINEKRQNLITSKFINSYRDIFWQKKSYK